MSQQFSPRHLRAVTFPELHSTWLWQTGSGGGEQEVQVRSHGNNSTVNQSSSVEDFLNGPCPTDDGKWILPDGSGVLQLDDLWLAEVNRHQVDLQVLLNGGQRDEERFHVPDGHRENRVLMKTCSELCHRNPVEPSRYLEYPSCLQAETPSQLFHPSEHTVLQTPPLWTCSTELRPLRRTVRQRVGNEISFSPFY